MEYTFKMSGSPGFDFAKLVRTESDIQDAIQEAIGHIGEQDKL
jgi:hypothetical protein